MGDDDPIARLRAEMDQSREGLKEFAGTLWAFYTALTGEGFDTAQAFALTMKFLSDGIRGPRASEDGE